MANVFWIFLILLTFFRVVLVGRPNYQNKLVQVTGIVAKDPKIYGANKLIVVDGWSFFVDRVVDINYGDKVTVVGKVDGRKIVNPKIEKVIAKKSFVGRLRQRILTVYRIGLPPADAGLVAGMVLGSKSLLTEKVWRGVLGSGTAHVVVASGTNVSLLAMYLLALLTYFTKRPKAVVLIAIVIWCYAVLCGLEAPIVRASLMVTIAFIGQAIGRKTDTLRIFLISFVIMLLVKPRWFYDLGFWLSYLATLSMLLFGRKLQDRLHFLPGLMKESLSTSLSAQIGVTPVLLLVFHNLNAVSPVINALVVPVVPTITVIGALGGLLGLLNLKLGEMVLYLVIPFTRWFLLFV